MRVSHRFVAAMAAVGLLLSDPAAEWLHHDLLPGTSKAGPSIADHACGPHERHIPADQIHPCGLCQQRLQHAGVCPIAVLSANALCVDCQVPPLPGGKFARLSYLHREKRGPPVA